MDQKSKLMERRNEFMKDIFSKYSEIINKNIKDIYFLYNGNKINEENKL